MFIPKEIKFLKTELHALLNSTQAQLEEPGVEGEKRYQLEEKLITIVSVVNKLEYAKSDKKTNNSTQRVLIVDDVASMRRIHQQLLSECGFRNIELVENGLKAYSMLRKAVAANKPYNLVISDWEMPKVSGLDLLRKVRTDKELWHTPFYLITGLGDKAHIVQGINSGATGYMVKPVNQKMVNQKFRGYLD